MIAGDVENKSTNSSHFGNNLNIVVDGVIYYSQKAGGISRLFSEILPRICTYDEGIRIQLLLNKESIQSLPQHEHIIHKPIYKIDPFLRPWRFWRHHVNAVKAEVSLQTIRNSKNKIWHSTYYTLPKRWKGTTVLTIYDLIYELYQHSDFTSAEDHEVRKRIRDAVLYSDKLIAISHSTKKDIESILSVADEKIQVIHLACSNIFRKIAYQKPAGRPFILYVGKRNGYKNFLGLLQSFAVWSKNKDFNLVVVGPDWSADEKLKVTDLGLSEKVFLMPYPDDVTLCNLYNQAFVFVFPSLYEGFGIPLLEAMACGCPIIASRIPSTIEIAGNIPIYHEPGNIEQMLSNMDQVYDEPRESERTLKGLSVAKTYSWDITARQTAEVYRSMAC